MATFVLLHGSFHAAWNWHKVIPLLAARGHRCVALDLPGHGHDRTPLGRVTLASCVRVVLAAIDRTDGEVVLVAHSRNGIVISQAAEHRPERVLGLIYLAAYLVPNGRSMMDYAVLDPDSQVVRNVAPAFDEIRVRWLLRWARHGWLRFLLARLLPARLQQHALLASAYREALYHDCAGEITHLADALLEPEPNWPGFTPLVLSEQRFGRVPKVYIECTEDRAVTPLLQQRMYRDSPCDRVLRLPSGHSPFFGCPELLVQHMAESHGLFVTLERTRDFS